MGTITIAINQEHLESNISDKLEKYLININPKLNNDEKRENKIDKKNNYLIKTGYNKHIYGFTKQGKYIMVCSEPSPFFNSLPDFKVTWHQSQWESQKEVVDAYVNIFGFENAKSIFLLGLIVRIDFWIDSQLSYETTRYSTYRPSVSISDQRKGDYRSFYLGTKGPKLALFYEKRIKANTKFDISLKRQSKDIDKFTRYEVRYLRKEVPIRHYADYVKTADIDVFKIMNTCLFSIKELREKLPKEDKKSKRIYDFLNLVMSEGLHHARKSFNKNRDFYRTIGPFLSQNGKSLNLSNRWNNKVKSKIVKDFDIRSYFQKENVNE